MISRNQHSFKMTRQGVTHLLEKPQLFLHQEEPEPQYESPIKPIKKREEDALGRMKKKSKYQRG